MNNLMTSRFGYIASRAIGVAVELDLFTAMADRPQTVEQLSVGLEVSPRGLRVLLRALVPLGLAEGRGPLWALTEEARTYLVKSSPQYVGGMILQADSVWNRWARLGDAVRQGSCPEAGIESAEDDGRFFAQFVQGLYNMNAPAAQGAARQLAGGGLRRVLDLGAGSGVWSIALAEALPDLSVVAVDRARILDEVTRPFVREHDLLDRFEFHPGDLKDPLPGPEPFDLIVLGHVLHSEGLEGSLDLLGRCREALRPGGRVLVAEMVPENERDTYGWLFGLNMLLLTEAGEVFSRSELEQLLQRSGFGNLEWVGVPAPYPLLLATR